MSKKVRGFFCERCRFYLHDIPSNWLADGSVSCYQCHHAAAFGNSRLGKKAEGIVKKPTPSVIQRATKVGDDIPILETAQQWDMLVLRYLNALARVEMREFRRVMKSKGLIIFKPS